ncbi:LysR family transcriptional regulator [Ruminococcaceae bacterium OttesenSCG-928-L11]|nr:LysR family transcriptional regulator [Ruminococcaceae bacterium OttesenSCG-928-L11]
MRGVSMELYRIFREIARTRNLTRAAERLYMTQPNVSMALKSLEEQLGAILCTRTKKGIVLTREGEALAAELDAAFGHIDAAERAVHKLVHLESGEISISAGDTICNYFLLPYITAFTGQYPHVRLGITNRTSAETAELVKSDGADFGFLNLPYPDDRLVCTPCCPINDILVAGPRYARLAESGVTLHELETLPLILLERKSNSRLCLDSFFAEQGATLRPYLELGSLDLIISFVKSDLGLSFIPRELCGHFVDGKTLFAVPFDRALPQRQLGLAERKGAAMSQAARRFKEMVLGGSAALLQKG